MIKEIQKPDVAFTFFSCSQDKFYFDDYQNRYFIKCGDFLDCNFIIKNNEAIYHNIDGYSLKSYEYIQFFINNKLYNEPQFAKETNHLVCKTCADFCKQKCF